MAPHESSYDVLIIGAGIFGTSTAYHLAHSSSDPSRILVIDCATCPSPQAASSDINKIVRADYSKPFYMNLAYEAMDGWENDRVLSQYYHKTGWIMLDEKGSDLAQRIRTNFKNSGRLDTSSDRSLSEVKTSWGGVLSGISTEGFDKAYFNTSAGWADASLAVEAWMQEAMSLGVQYMAGEARLVTNGKDLVGVSANNVVYTASRYVLATGAWTPFLMSSVERECKIAPDMSIDRQIQAAGVCIAAFKLDEREAKFYGQMPVLIYGSKGEVMPPNRERFLKFTNANTFINTCTVEGKKISVPHPDQMDIPPGLRTQSIDIIRQRIPEILESRQPDYWRLCWDAVSPDQNQLICQHPAFSSLYLATAGSFHSWKFLPNIGKYVVNVLNGKSNGEEKDEMWCWKTKWSDRGAHPKVKPKGELGDFRQSLHNGYRDT